MNVFPSKSLRRWLAVFGCFLFLASIVNNASARQDARPSKPKKDDVEIPEPEIVQMPTKDGVRIKGTYFGGTKGKSTIPIIMVHDWKRSKDDLLETAKFLQTKFGYAVIVPDLRGHGLSNTVGGEEVDLDRLKKAEIASITNDFEACKKFLAKRNNQGELNIDMLVVIAIGKSCIHAVQWTINDWSFGEFNGIKQGRDVKALVFICPEQAFKGLKLTQGVKLGLFSGRKTTPLSVLIAASEEDSKRLKDARSIQKAMTKYRPKVELETNDPEEMWQKRDFFFARYGSGQGAELLDPENGNLRELIVNFIYYRVEAKKDEFPWQDRSQ